MTPSCVPIESYVILLIIKKLPKKYPVFFVGSFTRNAENLVCKNIEIIGKVILVIGSKHNIFGITVNASSFSDNKCDTASEMTDEACFVSESVNSSKSPVAFLYPSIHAQFFPIHPSGFIFASTDTTLGNSLAYFLIISPVESSEESLMAIIS